MADVQNYQAQLQLVEANLVSDPTNEELVKLKEDLENIIQLTEDLEKPSTTAQAEAEESQRPAAGPSVSTIQWKAGDQCQAPWSQDGKYYPAIINSIAEDGSASVTFDEYQNTDTTTLDRLKHVGKRPASDYEAQRSKKQKMAAAGTNPEKQRELAKLKKQKKAERFKQLEQEREDGKNKWLAFASKKKHAIKKSSIFATPENADGRVGVGTCGVGGSGMTKFSQAAKVIRGRGSRRQ